tara:strand:- start:1572 stop:2705 length:1134 start_codon:yes stop_codon:yes gene_type:complete
VGIKNYWRGEGVLFGKVNKSLDVVEPNTSLLVSIPGQAAVFYVFPEVARAFVRFQESFKIPSQSGRLAADNYLNSPEPYRAYINCESDYNSHITSLLEEFNVKYLLETPRTDDIKDIKDYARHFFNYFLTARIPQNITKTSYILSPENSALSSGLTIEIGDLNPASNSDKQDFIESPNFEFYRQSAINSGFLIDKNIPWRLNFDLSSPVNANDLSPGYGTTDLASSYLTNNFIKANFDGIDYLASMVIVGYNSLVANRKYYREGKCKYLRVQVEKQEVLTETLPAHYWIKRYIQVRNKEVGTIYRPPELDKIIQYANDIPQNQMDYISSKFKMPYLHEGSTVYESLKKYYREKNNFSLDNFSEHVKIIINNSINKIY